MFVLPKYKKYHLKILIFIHKEYHRGDNKNGWWKMAKKNSKSKNNNSKSNNSMSGSNSMNANSSNMNSNNSCKNNLN